MQESGTVDRQPKSDGDENMIRVHEPINIDNIHSAAAWLNVTIIHFDCIKIPANIFFAKKYRTNFEC